MDDVDNEDKKMEWQCFLSNFVTCYLDIHESGTITAINCDSQLSHLISVVVNYFRY